MPPPDLSGHVAGFVGARGLPPEGLVGVSGGRDSVVLLHACRQAGLAVQAAHVNYGLRGGASDEDEAFVRALCARWNVPLAVERAAPPAPGASVQAWARQVRYAFFAECAAQARLPWVAVGHHQQDQVETVVLQALRGAGLVGLAGMAAVRPLTPTGLVRLVRPLLDVAPAALDAYAAAHGLAFRHDASNESLRYRRARVRHALLPALRALVGEGVDGEIGETTAARRRLLEAWAAARARGLEAAEANTLPLDVLEGLPARWQGRLVLDALERFLPDAPRSRAVARQVLHLVGAQVGRRVEFGAGTVWRTRAGLCFEPARTGSRPASGDLSPGSTLELEGGRVAASEASTPPSDPAGPATHCWLDAEAVRWPLCVRPWQPSDRLRPFGLGGTKKVSDLLTDARYPSHRRARALVVCADGEVVWVPGVRRAEAARVHPGTRQAVLLTWDPGT